MKHKIIIGKLYSLFVFLIFAHLVFRNKNNIELIIGSSIDCERALSTHNSFICNSSFGDWKFLALIFIVVGAYIIYNNRNNANDEK